MTRAGVAIGGGWQALVAYINIGCYYVIGLPLGYLLGYRANLGVQVCARSSSTQIDYQTTLVVPLITLLIMLYNPFMNIDHPGSMGWHAGRNCFADLAALDCALQNQLGKGGQNSFSSCFFP